MKHSTSWPRIRARRIWSGCWKFMPFLADCLVCPTRWAGVLLAYFAPSRALWVVAVGHVQASYARDISVFYSRSHHMFRVFPRRGGRRNGSWGTLSSHGSMILRVAVGLLRTCGTTECRTESSVRTKGIRWDVLEDVHGVRRRGWSSFRSRQFAHAVPAVGRY